MGFISDFLGGVADAGAELSKQALLDRAEKERNEAMFRKEQSLEKLRQKFQTSEREARQEFDASQNELNRSSDERLATLKRKSDGYKAPTVKEVIDPSNPDNKLSVQWDAEKGKWVPFGQDASSMPRISLDRATEMARREYEDKASMFKSDQSQFGMTENEWINRRALEIMGGKIGSTTPARVDQPSPHETKGKTPKAGGKKFVSKEEYIQKALIMNKGEASEAEIRAAAERLWNAKYGESETGAPGDPAEPEKDSRPSGARRQTRRKKLAERAKTITESQKRIVKEIAGTDLSSLSRLQLKALLDKLDSSTFGVTGFLDDDVRDQRARLRKALRATGRSTRMKGTRSE